MLSSILLIILYGFVSLLSNQFFWIVIILVWLQYRRMTKGTEHLLKISKIPAWRITLTASIYGVLGGILGSILLILVGVSTQEIGIMYLWLAALFLLFFEQRFLCFAYAGGLLSVIKYFTGMPKISIPHVMALVAVLHMVEALLIYLSGHREILPTYAKNHDGRVVGGYNLQKFWPLPLVALVTLVNPSQEILSDVIKMPDWWPLIKSEFVREEANLIYFPLPIVAALGYGDIALTTLPRDKTKRTAIELGLYSLLLLVLAVIASKMPLFAIVPALFGPLGHEYLIRLGQRRETKGEPIFVPSDTGVRILYLLPSSPLEKSGLKAGDIVLYVNGAPVSTKMDLNMSLYENMEGATIRYLRNKDHTEKVVNVRKNSSESWGIVPVPEGFESSYMQFSGSASIGKRWWKKIRRK